MYLGDHKEGHKTGRRVSDSRATLMALDLQPYLELPAPPASLFGYCLATVGCSSPVDQLSPDDRTEVCSQLMLLPPLSSVGDSCKASVFRTVNGKARNSLGYTSTSWLIHVARNWRTVLLSPETHVSYLMAVMDVSCWYCTQRGFPMGNGKSLLMIKCVFMVWLLSWVCSFLLSFW